MTKKGYKATEHHKLMNSLAQKKRYANLTIEERKKFVTPEMRQKMSNARKKWWANMTQEEREVFRQVLARMRPSKEAKQKSSITQKKRFARMTKEQRIELAQNWIKAGNKAVKDRWAKISKEEKTQHMLKMIKASKQASPSSIEKMIWKVLNELDINYKTQMPFNGGNFIVDIYIPSQRLIIECNENYWHDYSIFPKQKCRDNALEEYAKKNDYKIIWLWEDDIKKNPKQILKNELNKCAGNASGKATSFIN